MELLEPVDLLSLIRCTKMLRRTLMSRKAAVIWKRAAKTLPLPPPECPADMSEPAWANLIFGDPKCQVSHRTITMIFVT